ncbi:MAG: rhodanese-like domain-containing protein, partial [Opitutae bacterium]|nr:rhodanese-like domain-containing protein [Opitutae bacterium]
MDTFDSLLKKMGFDFFGSGQHKIEFEQLFADGNGLLLDVRSREEHESLEIKLQYHLPVVWIPIDEIPERYEEVPRDKTIG